MRRVSPGRLVVTTLLGVSALLVFAFALSACGASGVAATGDPTTATAASSSRAAPAFSGVTLDGKTVSLDQYRGKPLLLVYMTYT